MADSKVTQLTESTSPASTDLVYVVANPAGTPADRKVKLSNLLTAIGAQPLDSDLTAIAALTTTSYGRALLALADAAALRTAAGLGTAAVVNTGTSGANVPTITQADARYQALDSDLTAIAALSTTSYGRAFLALADAAAARTAIDAQQAGTSVAKVGAASGVAATDTATLQAALTAGGNVELDPSAVYIINAALTYPSGINLQGNGATIKAATGLGGAIRLLQPAADDVADAVIEGVVFDQRGDLYTSLSTACVSIDKTVRVKVRKCTFKNVITMAVWCDSTVAHPCTAPMVSDNVIVNSYNGGLSLFGTITDFEMSRNLIFSCQDDAIAIQADGNGVPVGGTISNNRIKNCNRRGNAGTATPHGILVFGAQAVVVANNAINGTVSDGICVRYDGGSNRATDVSVTGNTILNSGISVDSTAGVSGCGIFTYNADRVTVSGNVVKGSRGEGITLFATTEVEVGFNDVNGNGNTGILFERVQGFTCVGNACWNNGDTAVGAGTNPYGIFLLSDGAGTSAVINGTVIGNVCGDNRSGGAKKQTYGIFLTGSDLDAVTIFGNTIPNSGMTNGNATGALQISGGGITWPFAGSQIKLVGNPGFNPQGPVGPPSVPATTVAYTNKYGVDATVYVIGGTVTVVAISGTTTGSIAGCFRIPAGQTITLTYSVAPTWVWFLD